MSGISEKQLYVNSFLNLWIWSSESQKGPHKSTHQNALKQMSFAENETGEGWKKSFHA